MMVCFWCSINGLRPAVWFPHHYSHFYDGDTQTPARTWTYQNIEHYVLLQYFTSKQYTDVCTWKHLRCEKGNAVRVTWYHTAVMLWCIRAVWSAAASNQLLVLWSRSDRVCLSHRRAAFKNIVKVSSSVAFSALRLALLYAS